ncbi:MAG: fasciclin domain-containing protein [Anaerolineae bacterium]|nr:fasciclin domain-containing protein [Anaerolineae bacterium]
MKTYRILTAVLVSCLFVLVGSAAAQQPPASGGAVRIVQLVYDRADVLVNGEAVAAGLPYPLTSDYFPLNAGPVDLAVVPVGADTGPSVALDVAEGHRYTVAVTGARNSDTAQLLVIDETADVMQQAGDSTEYTIMIHNVADAPAVDVYFNDTLVGTGMGYGGYILARVPAGTIASRATLAGGDFTVFTSDYLIIPGTVSMATLAGDFALFTSGYRFPYERFSLRVSDQPVGEFLAAYNTLPESNLSTFFAALDTAGLLDSLNGDEAWTVFAPSNAAFDALPDGTLDALLADPAALEAVLKYHLVPGYYPSTQVEGDHSLVTAQGAALDSRFTPGESFTLNGSVRVGLENRAGNGVVYVIDTVLLPPGE